jgi:hypothetical protein
MKPTDSPSVLSKHGRPIAGRVRHVTLQPGTSMHLLRRLAATALIVSLLPAAAAAQAPRSRAAGAPPRGTEGPRHYSGGATGAAITAADLMTRLYIYADDSMMGRDANSTNNMKGTAYIEREARRLGLEPAGEDGYFQYPLVNRATDATLSTLSVDGTSYVLWKDFAPRDQGGAPRSFDGATVVVGGSIGDTAHFISHEAAAGKVVLLTLARDSTGNRAWSVNRFQLTARFPTAAAIAVVQLDWAPPEFIRQVFMASQLGVRGETPDQAQPSYLYVSAAVGRAMLGGADPETAAPGTAGHTIHGVASFGETRGPGRNVVGILRGSDPVLRNEFVAIGAHNDHVGYSSGRVFDHDSVRAYHLVAAPQGADGVPHEPTAVERERIRVLTDSLHAAHGGPRADSVFNGADDDGSGTVSVLEIAEYFARAHVRPKRSLLFIWHTGEEYGMLGSRYFTSHPTVPRDSIVAELNVDMIGRGGDRDITGMTKDSALIHGGPGYVQLIGSRRLSTELGDLAERVNAERHFGLHFDYALDANGHPQNIYCRSDHAMYARWGIPIVFFTTGGHADYHQVTDEPQYIDYRRMERVATMIAALGERVANLDHRVVLDKPRPDPNAPCQQ